MIRSKILQFALLMGAASSSCLAAESLIGFEKEDLEPDEAGLWMVVEKQEQDIRTSSILVQDEELNQFVTEMTCDLVGESCSYLRPYIIRAPGFNAFMMPNGAFFIQSGLLLRASNSSELAAVIGHEASHYFRNHTINRFRSSNSTANTFAVLSAVVSAASTVSVNSATTYESLSRRLDLSSTAVSMLQTAQIVAALQLLDYSREQESEADIDGVAWMSSSEYVPSAAVDLWQSVISEQEAGGELAGFSMVATHPAPVSRMNAISDSIREFSSAEPADASAADALLFSLVNRHRDDWLSDELHVLPPSQFQFLVDKQVVSGYPEHRAAYLIGLSYFNAAEKASSKREQREFLTSAVDAFSEGIVTGSLDIQAEMYRDLGKSYELLGMQAEAQVAYQQYLDLAPDAWDARFIKRKL
jgi:Zn-dependent protease with chaperone function